MDSTITIKISIPKEMKTSARDEGSLLQEGGAGSGGGAHGGHATKFTLQEGSSPSAEAGLRLVNSLLKALTAQGGEPAARPAPAKGQASGAAPKFLRTSEPPPARIDGARARPTRQEATEILKQNFAKIDKADGWGKSNGNGTIERDELESAAKSDDKELAAAARAFLDHGDAWGALAALDGDAGSVSMSDLSGDDGKAKAAAEDAKIKGLSEKMSGDEAAVRLRDGFDKIKDPASGYINRESLDKAAKNKDLPPELRAACMRVASDEGLFRRLDNGADLWNKGDSLIGIQDLRAETQDSVGEQIGNIFGLGKLAYW